MIHYYSTELIQRREVSNVLGSTWQALQKYEKAAQDATAQSELQREARGSSLSLSIMTILRYIRIQLLRNC